jgi:hypothetical protein
MAGTDTWRGIDFQAAYTVDLALRLLSGEGGEILGVDPGPDIVDYSIREGDGSLSLLGQAKTRSEPYTWPPGELTSIIRRLADVPGGENARLEFLTDGALSPETLASLAPAIERVAGSEATAEDWEYLARYELTREQAGVLARVDIYSGYDSAGAQLEAAVRRVRALRDLTAPVSDDEAEHIVSLLVRAITERGTRRHGPCELSREQIGEIVAVPPATVDSAQPWSEELATRQRALIAAAPVSAHTVDLKAKPVARLPTYTQLAAIGARAESVGLPSGGAGAEGDGTRSALDLLDGDCAIFGSIGAGKSTTLQALARRAAGEGLTAVVLSPVSYRAGELGALARRAVSRQLALELGPGVGATLLAHPDTVLLIDRAGEQATPEMARALARDIAELRERVHAPTVILAARTLTTLRPFNLPAYKLQSLDRQARRAIATSITGDEQFAGQVCASLERDVHGAVDNPLLFTMAVGLVLEERPPASIGEIFAGFLQGLRVNAQSGLDWELAIPCLGVTCADMIAADKLTEPHWDWLVSLEQTLLRLSERGLSGTLTAAEVIAGMQDAGVLVADDGGSELSLLHDSFRDWLAALAIKRGLAQLPGGISPDWRAVAGYLAEAGTDPDTLVRFCEDPVVGARAASLELRQRAEHHDELATTAFNVLIQHLAPEIREGVQGMRVVTREERGHTRVLLTPVGDGSENLEGAVLGADLPAGAGPLSCAFAMWAEHLRQSLRERASLPEPVPDERAALAAAIEARFSAQREQLEQLIGCTLPGLEQAVIAHAGWSGLEGNVGPASENGLGRRHPFNYGYNANTTRVTINDHVDRSAFTTRTSAEDWLRPSPYQAALKALRAALSDLLVGFSA